MKRRRRKKALKTFFFFFGSQMLHLSAGEKFRLGLISGNWQTFIMHVLSAPHRTSNDINVGHFNIISFFIFPSFSSFPTEIGAIPTYQDNHLEDDRFSPGFLTIGQKYSYAIGSTVILPCKINETGTCFVLFSVLKLFLSYSPEK